MWKGFTRKHASEAGAPAAAQPAVLAEDKAARNRAFFEDLWRQGDFWRLETDVFEQGKFARQRELLADRRYRKVLEIGCGAGAFTRSISGLADRIVAIDVSPAAIERASQRGDGGGVIDYRVANVLDYEPQSDGPFDLIVMSETIYYLGWLYTFFEVSWLAAALFDATADEGRFLLTNTYGGDHSYLHRPWVIHTYRDLFRNVGYRLERDETFHGVKDGAEQEARICVFSRPCGAPHVAV
jgi:SAM-dependent methyltransferase